MEIDDDVRLMRNTRLMLGLSQEEAGRLVGVTKRAWEHWEAGTRKVPTSAFELFIAKASGILPSSIEPDSNRELVVVLAEDGMSPIDVVSNENFLSITAGPNAGLAIIHSLAIERFTGKRSRHSTRFLIAANPSVLKATQRWKAINEAGAL